MPEAETRNLFTISPDQKLLGDVVIFNTKGIKGLPYARVTQALSEAGLDPVYARQVLPRNAFLKAARKLEKEKVISKLSENKEEMFFQVTREEPQTATNAAGKMFAYDYETVLCLDKDSGAVTCPEPGHEELVQEAQELVKEAIDTRDAGQVNSVTQRIFNDCAALFPLRDQGGVYFVPARHKDIEDKVAGFLAAVGGKLTRLPVPMGTAEGNESVKDSVNRGLQALIDEHRQAVEAFDVSTREDTLKRAALKIEETRFKIEAYAEYLDGVLVGRLLDAVAEGRERLRAKADEIAGEKEDAKNKTGAEAPHLEEVTCHPTTPF